MGKVKTEVERLRTRVEQLERELAVLRAQQAMRPTWVPVVAPSPTYVGDPFPGTPPFDPFLPYRVTCSGFSLDATGVPAIIS